MLTTDEYLASIHLALMESSIVLEYAIVRQRLTSQSGHLRVRVRLTNGDFLEAAEFFRSNEEGIIVVDYRHQWMDAGQTILRKRWDSTPHHPEIENSPHHIHIGSEENVLPGQPISIQAVLETIANEIG
jgi:hypothetical protein